jgi:hypothetical protein
LIETKKREIKSWHEIGEFSENVEERKNEQLFLDHFCNDSSFNENHL